MAFLLINGLEFPVRDGTYSENFREVGSSGPAYSGQMRRQRRALKRDIRFESSLLSGTEADAWTQLINATGQSWTFNSDLNHFSTKGMAPTTMSNSPTIDTGTKKFGTAALKLTWSPLQTATFTWSSATNQPGRTLACWAKIGAGAWSHYVLDEFTGHYLNGAATGGTPAFISSFTGTQIVLTGSVGGDTYIDDMHVWPFSIGDVTPAVATTWASAWYNLASGLSDATSPVVIVGGEALEELSNPAVSYRRMVGRVESAKLAQGVWPAAFAQDLRTLSVVLEEL